MIQSERDAVVQAENMLNDYALSLSPRMIWQAMKRQMPPVLAEYLSPQQQALAKLHIAESILQLIVHEIGEVDAINVYGLSPQANACMIVGNALFQRLDPHIVFPKQRITTATIEQLFSYAVKVDQFLIQGGKVDTVVFSLLRWVGITGKDIPYAWFPDAMERLNTQRTEMHHQQHIQQMYEEALKRWKSQLKHFLESAWHKQRQGSYLSSQPTQSDYWLEEVPAGALLASSSPLEVWAVRRGHSNEIVDILVAVKESIPPEQMTDRITLLPIQKRQAAYKKAGHDMNLYVATLLCIQSPDDRKVSPVKYTPSPFAQKERARKPMAPKSGLDPTSAPSLAEIVRKAAVDAARQIRDVELPMMGVQKMVPLALTIRLVQDRFPDLDVLRMLQEAVRKGQIELLNIQPGLPAYGKIVYLGESNGRLVDWIVHNDLGVNHD